VIANVSLAGTRGLRMRKCPFCAEDIQDSAIVCRHCGRELTATPADLRVARGPGASGVTETTSAKGQGAASGFAVGLAGSGCLFMAGLLLTFTGIGALIGIPMILGAVLLPFIGALVGLGTIKGPCPHCGQSITAQSAQPGIDCQACKRRIVIREKRFFKA